MNDDNEYELLYMYRKGDLQALDLLMKMVLPFVIKTYASIAVHWPSFESDEARQAAWLGVINAVYYFREDRKMSFRNFILMCVERQMYSALRHHKRISRLDYLSSMSMDRLIPDCDELYLGDTLSRDSSLDPRSISRYRALLAQIYRQLEDNPLDSRVLSLRVQGYTYQETASILGIRKKDVDNAVQRIRKKISYLFD
ncbi:MAG: sigma-70 family RNA polymerase sigma factor [Erysipelotrichaceae bacterium]|nr:sigma-70 family RNA polymerase sigma factor [Erysipelotrichaceae bacterium]